MREKEETEKAGLKLTIQKTKILTSSHITSCQVNGGKVETVTDFIFLGSKITFKNQFLRWHSGKESTNAGDGFDPLVRKIPWGSK